RLAAIERLPDSQRGRVLYLLADPHSAPRISSWLSSDRRPRLPATAFTLVLGLRRAGHLEAPVAAMLLDDLESSAVLDHGNFGPRRDVEVCRTLVSAAVSAAEHFGGDALDPIFAIVLGADAALRRRLLLRYTERLLQTGLELRLRAAAAALVSLKGASVERAESAESPELCAEVQRFVCHLVPESFGSAAIPAGVRRRAARELLELRGALRVSDGDALGTWIQELCEPEPGRLDLSVVAGLLRLAQPNDSAAILSAAVEDERLIEAFLAAPIASAPLLSPRCLLKDDRRALLGRLCARDPARFGAIVALSIWVLPFDQLTLATDLEPGQVLEVLRASCELEQRSDVELGAKKVRAVVQACVELLKQPAEVLAPAVVEATLSGLLPTWLEQPDPSACSVAVCLFGTVVEPLAA